LWEAFDRYGGPLWWKLTHPNPPPPPPDVPPADELAKDEAVCSDAVKQMIQLARGNHVPHVLVAQYLFPAEISGAVKQGHGVLLDAIRSEGIEPDQLGDAFKRAVQGGENPFGDIRHPNALGHQIIGEELAKVIEAELRDGPTTNAASHVQ
jgi:lysophospholipase L1-like esterase